MSRSATVLALCLTTTALASAATRPGLVRRAARSLVRTRAFMIDSMGALGGRADAVVADHGKIRDDLKAGGFDPRPHGDPSPRATVAFRGTITSRGNLRDFMVNWDHLLSTGNGSVNDRMYVDQVARLAKEADRLPLLRHLPITSREVFSGQVVNGQMRSMRERTKLKLLGVIPIFTAVWNMESPAGSLGHPNPFEDAINHHHGDMAAVQRDYRQRFDPRAAGQDIKAKVVFSVASASAPASAPAPGQMRPFFHHMDLPWYARLSLWQPFARGSR